MGWNTSTNRVFVLEPGVVNQTSLRRLKSGERLDEAIEGRRGVLERDDGGGEWLPFKA